MPSLFRTFAYSSAALALTLMVGCSSGESVDPQPTEETSSAPAETAPAATASNERIRLRANGGAETLVLKVKGNDATLENGTTSFELTADSDQSVQVKDAAGASLALVTVGDSQWVIGNASQSEDSYVLQRLEGGDFRLETADGQAVYDIQKRGYGYEVLNPDETSLYKLRMRDGRMVLRDADNAAVMTTKDALLPAAMLPFAFEVLSSEQQIALAYALHRAGN